MTVSLRVNVGPALDGKGDKVVIILKHYVLYVGKY